MKLVRKLFICLMCLSFAFGSSVQSFTSSPQFTNQDNGSYIGDNPSDQETVLTPEHRKQIKTFMAQFKDFNRSKKSYNIMTVSPSDYYLYGVIKYQNRTSDGWYDDTLLGGSSTIGGAGCGLCSFTMLLNIGHPELSGYLNPDLVNTTLYWWGQYPNSVSNDWGSVYGLYNYGYYTVATYGESTVKEIVACDMSTYALPFMLRLSNGSSQHYVLARGYSESGGSIGISIYDPWYPRDYSTLQQYYNAGCGSAILNWTEKIRSC